MKAIDVHVHVKTGDYVDQSPAAQQDAVRAFKTSMWDMSPDAIAEYYIERDIHACIFSVDKETSTGLKSSNDEVAALMVRYPDTFTGIASVDPWKGQVAITEVIRAVRDLGLRGVKFQPITQAFFPSDRRFYPLWDTISSLGVPAIFHTGTTGVGRGSPGGRGLHLKYGRPVPDLDDLAADFPGLQIVAAHPGWPWHEELLAVVQHKKNVFMDLSGWGPKYLPSITVKYAKSLISEKVLFGSDFPLLSPDRWLEDFSGLGFKDAPAQLILRDNAAQLFGIPL